MVEDYIAANTARLAMLDGPLIIIEKVNIHTFHFVRLISIESGIILNCNDVYFMISTFQGIIFRLMNLRKTLLSQNNRWCIIGTTQ